VIQIRKNQLNNEIIQLFCSASVRRGEEAIDRKIMVSMLTIEMKTDVTDLDKKVNLKQILNVRVNDCCVAFLPTPSI